MNLISGQWKDYEILDCGDGMKLERWGDIILERPDPQVIWECQNPDAWKSGHAKYNRSSNGGGSWEYKRKMPQKWTVSWKNLKFWIEPMGFKHTGLFPEQAANWEWMIDVISKRKTKYPDRKINILNLFGYTGGATVACASAGAAVCHVDASKGMVQKAGENILLSGLENAEVRYIVDDAFKFVSREIRRGKKYDGIIMDPPSYGRGPGGEVWKLEDNLYGFVKESMKLLSDEPLFFLLNSYTTGFSPVVTGNILRMTEPEQAAKQCEIRSGDLLIPIHSMEGTYLPCGSYAALVRKDDEA